MERHATPILASALVTLICLFLIIAMWMGGVALGAAVGTSTEIHNYAINGSGAINAAMVEADGQFWFAVEHAPSSAEDDRHLDLFHDDGTTIHRVTLSAGELTGNATRRAGMYPTLITGDGVAHVFVAGKVYPDPNQPEAHLKFFLQDRDDFSVPFRVSNMGNVPAGISHGRAHLTWDTSAGTATERMYLCWVAKDATPNSDDLRSRVKRAYETWPGRPIRPVAVNANVDDDHCVQDFDHNGARFMVFHSEVNGHDGIFLDVERYLPATGAWADFGQFELPLPAGHNDADFPSISIQADAASSLMVVAAKSLTNDDELLSWTCGTAAGVDCRSVTQWTALATDLNGSETQPKVAMANGHRFVVYESGDVIRIASMCSGQTDWTHEGTLNPPAAYLDPANKQVFGVKAGDSVQSFVYDSGTDTLHAVYVMQLTNYSLYNPIHWQSPVTAFCP